jgi:hypothetical protein
VRLERSSGVTSVATGELVKYVNTRLGYEVAGMISLGNICVTLQLNERGHFESHPEQLYTRI